MFGRFKRVWPFSNVSEHVGACFFGCYNEQRLFVVVVVGKNSSARFQTRFKREEDFPDDSSLPLVLSNETRLQHGGQRPWPRTRVATVTTTTTRGEHGRELTHHAILFLSFSSKSWRRKKRLTGARSEQRFRAITLDPFYNSFLQEIIFLEIVFASNITITLRKNCSDECTESFGDKKHLSAFIAWFDAVVSLWLTNVTLVAWAMADAAKEKPD